MDYEKIRFSLDHGVAVIRFNDPDTLNALGQTLLGDFAHAVERVAAPGSGARCLVITGEGRGFSSGANLTETGGRAESGGAERDIGAVLEKVYHPLLLKLRDLEMPIVTAINGPAAGAGMSFALMGDIVVAAKSAYFLQAFRRIGLIPDAGSTWLLPRLVGWRRAAELMLMGEKLPADKALDWGLVTKVVEDGDLDDVALGIARDLAEGPTRALTLIRKTLWQSFENTYENQLHLERVLQKEAGLTEDFMEGVSAFLQKRKADFKGA